MHVFDFEINEEIKGICRYGCYKLGHLDAIKIPLKCIFSRQPDNKCKNFADLASRSWSDAFVSQTDSFIWVFCSWTFLLEKCSEVRRTLVKGTECCGSAALASLSAADGKTNSNFSFLHLIASCFTSLSHLKWAFTLELRPGGIKVSQTKEESSPSNRIPSRVSASTYLDKLHYEALCFSGRILRRRMMWDSATNWAWLLPWI